ncbi:MAG TPA: flagellar hook-basal body complex protein, partial [Clostridiaceae bacterium]|nr:flagellar hook-basal body complex protein [Clostridiaceae bacterium]
MMRALWTAGSGMIAQQFNVDVISNNLANVNTTAYKKERVEFKDLLYSTLSRAYVLEDRGRPVNLQVGHGTTVSATVKDFQSGSLEKTDNPLEFAIDG